MYKVCKFCEIHTRDYTLWNFVKKILVEFLVFGSSNPMLALMGWNLVWRSGPTPIGSLVHAKFHSHRCNMSDKPQNHPLSNLNIDHFCESAILWRHLPVGMSKIANKTRRHIVVFQLVVVVLLLLLLLIQQILQQEQQQETMIDDNRQSRRPQRPWSRASHTHTHNRFTALWNLSGTTRVSRYPKKHSPTHTHRGHQSSQSAFSIYYEP